MNRGGCACRPCRVLSRVDDPFRHGGHGLLKSVAPTQAAVLHEREEQRPVIHDRTCEEQSIRRNPVRQRRKVALGGVMSAVQVQLQTE